jgi:hypothetical protein
VIAGIYVTNWKGGKRMEPHLKKDFLYYNLRLTYLHDEMEKKKAEGYDTPKILPLYFEAIFRGYLFAKITANERIAIKKLKDEKYG